MISLKKVTKEEAIAHEDSNAQFLVKCLDRGIRGMFISEIFQEIDTDRFYISYYGDKLMLDSGIKYELYLIVETETE